MTMTRIAAALVLIAAVVACAPTLSEQMDACVEQNRGDWRA